LTFSYNCDLDPIYIPFFAPKSWKQHLLFTHKGVASSAFQKFFPDIWGGFRFFVCAKKHFAQLGENAELACIDPSQLKSDNSEIEIVKVKPQTKLAKHVLVFPIR
jgi:hypothetical protein